ncbi:glycosyltransferase family 4 protein [Paralimibaculum aggregatum]|uniref:glycosyltransferase family 4 protein n=1 Tax=Paralimibaculum aggregatum TaxID=3036245 RepID=UPI0025571ECC|nr:glycosyltransferase family 4 protein [Limibaculum sp. NKW23]
MVNDPAFFLSHRLEIARAARDAGWEVWLVTPPEPAAAVARIRAEGFAHAAVEMGRGRIQPRRDIAVIGRLARLFREIRPDLVHLVTIKPVLYGGVAARLARVPAVAAAISGLGYLFISKGARARAIRAALVPLYRLALNRPCAAAIFQNADDRAVIEGLGVRPGGGVEMIRGSGTMLAAFRPEAAPETPPLVVVPARLLRDKGAREFVEAARLLRRRGVAARFAWIGAPDPANPACVDAATRAGWEAEGAAEFWGQRGDVPEILARASLVVLPSYREGMPKALIEAAAAGRAVVTTDVPGCRDAIEPGVTGLLVPPRDGAALAEAIAALLADPARRAAMGRAGRALAERAFAVEDVAARHLALWERLLAARGAVS